MWLNLFRFLQPFCVHSSCHIYRSSLLKEHFRQKKEQSSSAGTIRAFVLCISAFVLFHALPPPISMQLKLQRPPSIGLLCGHRIETIQPLSLFCSPSLLSYTQRAVHVPWQRAWRHRWLHEPPCSALFSEISFGIESWGEEASGVHAHSQGRKREKRNNVQVNEIRSIGHVIRGALTVPALTACQGHTRD